MEELFSDIPNILSHNLVILWDVLKNWGWLILPFILYRPFLFLWLWWRREKWMMAQKKVLLEIKMPREILKPIRAMEQVFSALWGNVYDPDDWWEKWIDGKMLDSIQLEMVSMGGEPRLYIRITDKRRNAVESAIYSQYPETEISVVDDYAKYVPQGIPNKDWDLWGCDFHLAKEDVYPIKTYHKFFEEKPDTSKEEKRVDPMATLLEGMAKLGPGEQLWIQIAITPVTSNKNEPGGDFVVRGREIADGLSKRGKKTKPKSILWEATEELVSGKIPGSEEKEEKDIMKALIPPEMRLTPGEKIILEGVEAKIAKRVFASYIRFIYLARRDVYFGGAKAIPFGFFAQFATENLNAIKPWAKTITKIHKKPIPFLNLVRLRRLFIRKRRLFRNYVKRFPPLWPKTGGTYILDTEELATIFHFPGRVVAPAPFVSRVESKKGEAPPGLPTE